MNEITRKLYDLYKPDDRPGDQYILSLRIVPQIYCFISAPLSDDENKIHQIALRILTAIVILPSAFAMTIIPAIVGMVIKSFSKPKIHSIAQTLFKESPQATNENLPLSNSKASKPLKKKQCVYSVNFVSSDCFIHIAKFLSPKEIVKSMTVSKEFSVEMRSPIIWGEILEESEFRLYGATRWAYIRPSRNESPQYIIDKPDMNNAENHPYLQLKAYEETRKKGISPEQCYVLDYFARLMKGGPVAFNKIPWIDTYYYPVDFTLRDVPTPIVIGRLPNCKFYIALRLKDCSQPEQKPFVLVLSENPNKYWEQQKNCCWEENSLRMSVDNHLNYVLALINKEEITEENFQGLIYKKSVKLDDVPVI